MTTCFRIISLLCLFGISLCTQAQKKLLHSGWQFRKAQTGKWHAATVPGTVHTDLLANRLIADPYYRDNEKKLQWIDTVNWEYKTSFTAGTEMLQKKHIELVFDGLDTYADVYLNNQLILSANNMFRQWKVDVKKILKSNNTLHIVFHSAKNKADSMAKAALPLVLPDHSRAYVRKAQYHFGWDWGPVFITSGIWKNVYLDSYNTKPAEKIYTPPRKVELVQEADSIGRSFYFKINGKPVYMKGANYIPSEVFLPRLKKEDYRKVILAAKNANMNMLRIWGGGIYEDDAFYDLCDEYGIYVWQDFMFAGAMVPGDKDFINNVHEEVKYQIERLRHHPCIVVWCGNNEIDEAWHNWGWQKQFNLYGKDSAKVWEDYKKLFQDSIAAWVNRYDGARPYTSTSPLNGWGRPQSFTEGDSHFWGVWWGLQDIEVFETKTGRFISEYGMQAMPNYSTLQKITKPEDRFLYSDVINAHQKANGGFMKLNTYIHNYFMDSTKAKKLSVENYTYISQCMQYYAFKNSIAIHRSKAPVNMGTLLWQLNDCWPVSSWSITDYSRKPKAAWYAVKQAYRDDILPERDAVRPIHLQLQKPKFTLKFLDRKRISITADTDAYYVYLYSEGKDYYWDDNYFNLKAGKEKIISLQEDSFTAKERSILKVKSLADVML
ncbi:MAG: glycoside hydrolase family 2 TIM barrel-domain containing protein [Niabella sp.]